MRVETFTNDSGESIYYIVYLKPSGFVIVSADDLVEPIIGFADDGTYDPTHESPLVALVTNDLNRRISAVRSNFSPLAMTQQVADTKIQKKWKYFVDLAEESDGGFELMVKSPICDDPPSDVRIAPLVQSKWGQKSVCNKAGYNYFTPPGDPCEPDNYPCGCVATAMAQLMRYHRHPNESIEPNMFTISVDEQITDRWLLRGEGPDGTYNWDDMVLIPDCNTNDIQRRAIGALCHDAGISVSMEYWADGSGACLDDASIALIDTFQYDNSVWGQNNLSDIDSHDLIQMINPNLDADSPVILGFWDRPNANRAHASICDGYGYDSSTLYHHLNMGWDGLDDCWYNLATIDCPNMGEFDTIDECIYNIFPDGMGEIISGRIIDATGKPIEDVVVTAKSGRSLNDYATLTNSKGIYALKGLDPNSKYIINVNKVGYDFEPKQKYDYERKNEVNTETSSDGNSSSGNKWGIDFTAYSNCVTTTIGAETSDWDYPMHTNYHDSRTQLIYLAGEIGSSGTITALALDVTKVPDQIMGNWTIRTKHTSLSEYNICSLDATGWTVVYQNEQEIDSTGWQRFEFQTPFEYNGIDNLLVDFSHNNSSHTQNGNCRASSPGPMRSVYAYSNSQHEDPLDWSLTTSPTMQCSNNIPNIKLTICRQSRVICEDIQKLIAPDGERNDHFGCSVSISGDYAVVGAFGEDNNAGSAYVFKRSDTSWTQQAKLTALERRSNDYFACSVSISGDYAIIGTGDTEDDSKPKPKGGSYRAYIFKRNDTSWIQQAELRALGGEDYDFFGSSVSIDGDYAIVGAPRDDEDKETGKPKRDLGSAYIFKRNGTSWIQQAKLRASDSVFHSYEYFGSSVSINGDYVIIGGEDQTAYIFKREGTSWIRQAKLISPNFLDDSFGHPVSISGEYAIVGAPGENINNVADWGSAYIFKRNDTSWTQQAKLIDPVSKSSSNFGSSVSIDGDYAIIGMKSDDDYKIRDCGSACIFKREGTSWIKQAKLSALDRTVDSYFGNSVSIDGDHIIIGAKDGDYKTKNHGSAYMFKPIPTWQYVIGDFDNDDDTDFKDFSILSARWLGTDSSFFCGCEGADLTNDGDVNFDDLKEFTRNWMEGIDN